MNFTVELEQLEGFEFRVCIRHSIPVTVKVEAPTETAPTP